MVERVFGLARRTRPNRLPFCGRLEGGLKRNEYKVPQAAGLMPHRTDAPRRPKLSLRQEQCLRGALELKSAKEVARDLGISSHAVEKHFRIAREKFGVATTAEAARLYAASLTGTESPHSGPSDLKSLRRPGDDGTAEGGGGSGPSRRFGEVNGAQFLDQPLSPRQTLLTIAAVSLGSIVALLILVACAEGIRSLVGR